LLPEIGYDGQKRLGAARVLVVGVGGLGAPASFYLAGAGIGTIGLIDDGAVERSNLHRQILYTEADIGRPKAAVAAERLCALNPDVTVVTHECRLIPENARPLFSGYDLVVDGSDNLPTRYIINDAAFLEGKPWVYASLYRSYGQMSVFQSPQTPCYRCLFPSAPAAAIPDCAEAGILGPLPGVLGTLQALEAMKFFVGFGESVLGWLVSIDLQMLSFSRIRIKRNPACPLCGNVSAIGKEGSEFGVRASGVACRSSQTEQDLSGGRGRASRSGTGCSGLDADSLEVDPATVASLLKAGGRPTVLLDVREDDEVGLCRLPGSVWIPLAQLTARANEMDANANIVVYCHTGHRSLVAAQWLRESGFPRAYSLAGGIDRWATEIDPSLPRY
jgi:adenylyltransferase/sulfurtransferase